MAESAHDTSNPPATTVYPAPPGILVGDTMVYLDWYQMLASGFAPEVRAVTIDERADAMDTLLKILDDVGGAAHLGPFEAEERAAGALVIGLLRYAQARNFSLWSATQGVLNEMAIAEGERFLAARGGK